jgi:hypothetical protein
MEKDANLSKLFRESGIVRAPEGFTKGVMDRIEAEPLKKPYKPLIGRTGRILLILFIAGIVVISLLYSNSGGTLPESAGRISSLNWQWPALNFNFDFIADLKISPWLLSTIVAIFLLVLSDAGLNRKKIL